MLPPPPIPAESEQQVDLVTFGNLIAKPLEILGDIGDVRRNAFALAAIPAASYAILCVSAIDEIACTLYRHQLKGQLAAHSAAAACYYRSQRIWSCSSLRLTASAVQDGEPR